MKITDLTIYGFKTGELRAVSTTHSGENNTEVNEVAIPFFGVNTQGTILIDKEQGKLLTEELKLVFEF